ncbi:MAG: recombinase family protein, partial [candidate division Zixibacteria bacterium]|nr:recombinase family protein [candidate division Zixibacteria bacterium]
MMDKPKKAIIYCRVSSKEQTSGYSLKNQEVACKAFAERSGYAVKRVFVNHEGESAKSKNRPVLKTMWE